MKSLPVSSEDPAEDINPAILFEVEIFPHCLVFEKDDKICLQEADQKWSTKTEALSP